MDFPPTEAVPFERARFKRGVPALESGDHLSGSEFLRRYQAMPEVKKAELIGGIVYMASPVRLDQHGEPYGVIQTWLGTYALATPGIKHAINATIRLGPDDVPQPDGLLRIVPECGGQSHVDERGYLQGAPELVVEVAASSASLDSREKLASYRRARVREFIVWRTEDEAIDWWALEEDEYRPLPTGAGALVCSRAFPGLWLDSRALLEGDGSKLIAKLQEGLRCGEHAMFVARLNKR